MIQVEFGINLQNRNIFLVLVDAVLVIKEGLSESRKVVVRG